MEEQVKQVEEDDEDTKSKLTEAEINRELSLDY